ncbi:MAG: Na+/H+ antiporter subunit E [Myxococcota bacterium]|nr:Na+/H+ antiporter subunit E [Myxococcota bacterium]
MARTLIIFVVLLATWLSWSGVYEPLTIGFGVASSAFVALLTRRLGADEKGSNSGFWLRLLLYLPYLFKEILLSNLHVARVILSPKMPIKPQLIRVPCGPKTPLGQTLYANSITLTPGTITLDLRDGSLLVHALTQDTAEGVQEGTMDRKCQRVEGQSAPGKA